jgi:AAA domain
MRILNFKVLNYKSFGDSDTGGSGALTPGINVIIGQNNSGKTALLEAITQRIRAVPHRSVRTHPTSESRPQIVISATLTVQFDRQELLEFVVDFGAGYFALLSPDQSAQSAINLFQQAGTPEFQFEVRQTISEQGESREGVLERCPQSGNLFHFNVRRPDLELRPAGSGTNVSLGNVVARALPNRIYLFGAERFNIGESGFGDQSILAPNRGMAESQAVGSKPISTRTSA